MKISILQKDEAYWEMSHKEINFCPVSPLRVAEYMEEANIPNPAVLVFPFSFQFFNIMVKYIHAKFTVLTTFKCAGPWYQTHSVSRIHLVEWEL